MTGTEKQISWATEIKATYCAALEQIKQAPRNPNATEAQLALEQQLYAIAEVDDACWWIDNRAYLQPKDARGIVATATNLSRGDFSLPR